MRLNKTHKETLIDFAINKVEVPDKLQKAADAANAKAEEKIGQFFASKLGPDLPTLKRHKVAEKLSEVWFIATEKQRQKHAVKDKHFALLFHLSEESEVWDCIQKSYGISHYHAPDSTFNAVLKADTCNAALKAFRAQALQDFRALLNSASTFKQACELWPEFENAAHLIMANTSMVIAKAELIKKVGSYKVAE